MAGVPHHFTAVTVYVPLPSQLSENRNGLPGLASVTFTVSEVVAVVPLRFDSSPVYTYVPLTRPVRCTATCCAFGVRSTRDSVWISTPFS